MQDQDQGQNESTQITPSEVHSLPMDDAIDIIGNQAEVIYNIATQYRRVVAEGASKDRQAVQQQQKINMQRRNIESMCKQREDDLKLIQTLETHYKRLNDEIGVLYKRLQDAHAKLARKAKRA